MIEQLRDQILEKFPDLETDIRKADDPAGFQFLNIVHGNWTIYVEYKSSDGFGVSILDNNVKQPFLGWQEEPDALFDTIDETLKYILDQLNDKKYFA